MQFKKYLEKTKQNPNSFSKKHCCSNATVWRAANGKALRPLTAQKISAITGGEVTVLELLFPKNKGQNQKATRNQRRHKENSCRV